MRAILIGAAVALSMAATECNAQIFHARAGIGCARAGVGLGIFGRMRARRAARVAFRQSAYAAIGCASAAVGCGSVAAVGCGEEVEGEKSPIQKSPIQKGTTPTAGDDLPDPPAFSTTDSETEAMTIRPVSFTRSTIEITDFGCNLEPIQTTDFRCVLQSTPQSPRST